MAYHQHGDRHPQNRNRPASTGRLELPNLAAWGTTDSREQRKLQLFQQALIRDVEAFRHRKMRREESLQSVFKQSKPNALARSGGRYANR